MGTKFECAEAEMDPDMRGLAYIGGTATATKGRGGPGMGQIHSF